MTVLEAEGDLRCAAECLREAYHALRLARLMDDRHCHLILVRRVFELERMHRDAHERYRMALRRQAI